MNIWVVITRFRGRSRKIEFFKHYNQLCFTIFYPGGLRAAEKSSGIYQQTNISRPKITHNQVVSTRKLAASSYQISCAQFQPQCSCLVQLIIAILDQLYHCYSHTEPGTNPVRKKNTKEAQKAQNQIELLEMFEVFRESSFQFNSMFLDEKNRK